MPSAPFCVIYNPSAGRLGTAGAWKAVQERLGGDAVYRPTEHAGQAVDLARQAAEEGFSTVVAAGGDGTVHEVVNGLVQSQRLDVAFAVLPLGSGNDYARNLKTPTDVPGMLTMLRSGKYQQLDVGTVTLDGGVQRYFCNTLGIGLGGAVTWEASRIRWMRGIPLYGWASLKAIWKHFQHCRVRFVDEGGEWETTLLYAVVALGVAEGGGFIVAPNALLDDGWFDLMYVSRMSRLGAMIVLPRLLWTATRRGCRAILEKRVKQVCLFSDKPMPVHADGEVLAAPQNGARECRVEMLPGRLKVCASA